MQRRVHARFRYKIPALERFEDAHHSSSGNRSTSQSLASGGNYRNTAFPREMHMVAEDENFKPHTTTECVPRLSVRYFTLIFTQRVTVRIAAQIAHPERQCVAFVGDGGFSMLMADFATAVKSMPSLARHSG
jgi:Thiamine pyrophosphate enzyme, C-terminal TPP binding domain